VLFRRLDLFIIKLGESLRRCGCFSVGREKLWNKFVLLNPELKSNQVKRK
jgi:hypothetical protein